jgi:hypothetical protein
VIFIVYTNTLKMNLAQDIFGKFSFNFSMLHDQGEIKVNGKAYNPRISFYDFDGSLSSTDEGTNLIESPNETRCSSSMCSVV